MNDPDVRATADETPATDGFLVEEWRPGVGISIVWTILTLMLTIASFVVLTKFHLWLPNSDELLGTAFGSVETIHEGGFAFTINFFGVVAMLVSVAAVLALHEAIHGVMFRMFGGRPSYGAAMLNRVLPVLYCTAHGYWFRRGQFALIVLAPAAVITFGCLALMLATGGGMLLITPAAVNFGGSIGDFWMAGMLARRPSGTLIEDRKDGLRFFYPVAESGPGHRGSA